MNTANYWVEKLQLSKHPEGGWFREVYRSQELLPKIAMSEDFAVDRNIATSIYYLLEGSDFSAFHRIKSDEIWHSYAGTSGIEIITIRQNKIYKYNLGSNAEEGQQFQIVVPKNIWFAAHLLRSDGFALVGCTVSPGFHFDDFEMADKKLLNEYPHLKHDIEPFLKQENSRLRGF